MQTNWYNLFNFNYTITHECCNNSDHRSKDITSNIILRLPVRDDDGRAIPTLNHSVDQLFKKRIIHKNCEVCGDNTRFKKEEQITGIPEVLVVQYMRFSHYVGDGVHKIDDDIFSHSWLKLNNVMYELMGIVVHEGASINSGHYYSISRC